MLWAYLSFYRKRQITISLNNIPFAEYVDKVIFEMFRMVESKKCIWIFSFISTNFSRLMRQKQYFMHQERWRKNLVCYLTAFCKKRKINILLFIVYTKKVKELLGDWLIKQRKRNKFVLLLTTCHLVALLS